ncbi:hypothetical protein FACS189415_7700 [Bacteroidia bacterium]|nr:hypothetical protein FACS189415_7700 [Bacteroidia bacterium]
MGLNIQFDVVIAYAFGLVLLYIIGWLLLVPFKAVWKFLLNALLGGLLLWVLNLVGALIGLRIAINPITALVVGILGVPGVVLILVLQLLVR